MMSNQILRFSERPAGVYQCSVYHRFNGSIGPSAITCDAQGNLYIARYDYGVEGNVGIISILTPTGQLYELAIPGSELTGLAIDRYVGRKTCLGQNLLTPRSAHL